MVKLFIKLAVWLGIGAGATGVFLANTDIQTSWQYTVESTIAPGTQVTLTQPDGEPRILKVAEGQTLSGSQTIDYGGPATFIIAYVVGSVVCFMLKKRRAPEMP